MLSDRLHFVTASARLASSSAPAAVSTAEAGKVWMLTRPFICNSESQLQRDSRSTRATFHNLAAPCANAAG
jgi:hypothetical protein